MIGNRYWSTGIIVRSMGDKWAATVEYFDDGFASDDANARRISTEGRLHTRYMVEDGNHVDALTVVIDTVKADAERLGIEFKSATGLHVYYEGDGENPEWPPPDGWRQMVDAQSRRLGWEPFYTLSPAEVARWVQEDSA